MVDKRIASQHRACRCDGQRVTDHMEDVLHMVHVDSHGQPAIRTCGVQAIGGT